MSDPVIEKLSENELKITRTEVTDEVINVAELAAKRDQLVTVKQTWTEELSKVQLKIDGIDALLKLAQDSGLQEATTYIDILATTDNPVKGGVVTVKPEVEEPIIEPAIEETNP